MLGYQNDNKIDVFWADLEGKNISEVKKNNKWVLILGSEAHGLSKDFDNYHKITIQKFGDIESLNVSIACGIILEKMINNY